MTVAIVKESFVGNEAVLELMRPILDILTSQEAITELVINGPGKLLIETAQGWQTLDLPSLTYERLRSLATTIATYSNQIVGDGKPILSAMLPGGERIQVVMPPAVPNGTVSFTIRKPGTGNKKMSEYVNDQLFEGVFWDESGSSENMKDISHTDRDLMRLLKEKDYETFFIEAIDNHLNICIVGDTGSGKTTFMKSLCSFIPKHERIITIEDVREIFIDHPNAVHLLYSKGGQGQAKTTPAELIASCMRMKPDRVLLAELRGGESYDFLKLLTTGHSGSITSFHAATCREAIARFVLMAKEHPEASAYQDLELKRLLFCTMDVIAHMKAVPVFDSTGKQIGKKRRMTEIYFNPLKKAEIAYQT